MKIDYTVPVKIAYEMMDERNWYSVCQEDYVRIYRKYMFSGDLDKSIIKDVIDEYQSRLEFAWDKVCELDKQLLICANMLGIDNRFVFIQIARIYMTLYKDDSMDYVKSETAEKLIELLQDNEYNGDCLAPSEIKHYVIKHEWDKVM